MARDGTLIGTYYSPWTEKARWALDASGTAYRFVPHVAMAGELRLRKLTKRWTGRISVPIYFDESGTLMDSFDIATHAARCEQGHFLFPEQHRDTIKLWNERAERALAAGRQRALERTLQDPEALAASVPPSPLAVPPIAAWLGALGTRYVLHKYRALAQDSADAENTQREFLLSLREALRGKSYVLDSFSYVDVIAAVTLAFVAPHHSTFRGRSAAMGRAWIDPVLAQDFADLVSWRDRLYEQHRERAPRA